MTDQKIFELKPEYHNHIPEQKENGILYISKEFKTSIHLCACGCGIETVTKFDRESDGWTLTENNGLITLRPSIGNFSGQNPYHAHYYITNNKIEWL